MPEFMNMILHIDQFMGAWIAQYGEWIYLVLFLIVFGETGLVVLPFLPGDSLLFIAGAVGANGALDPVLLAFLLIVAAALGNTVNYSIGCYLGPRVFTSHFRFLDQAALMKTHAFYEKHGGKTIVLSRFVPIFRTFAPFVAGVGSMNILRFQLFNITGAVLWVGGLVTLGYFFGNVPIIKEHLSTIALLGVSAAIVPVALGGLWKLFRKARQA
ncbi:MAG TPA: VTT domain-containing protein [Eoetvoesiella sp.]|uniref:VTT domain-containing protein n=1 Tax=Eoetvoesiella sp. TaxID=1966355 RepID=UPI002C093F9F|nr:VTT domain-containing protein [Eoetvoesiella sp.]HWK60700.1 VTT domain-containing protein [Eoetvoesiella sp.]